jgi:DNA (cytosine-5)-methyltransferase 1
VNARPAFYNEYDPFAAAWLRELIADGQIAPGVVDERSILDVRPADLVGFGQCHFFAGIGGWSLALRLAGVPDDEPMWTGSCPCQPFSAAGRGAGMSDERHLWPAFYDLIRDCRPGVVFGEQVASAAVVGGAKPLAGPAWLDVVFDDLEAARYACGAADIPAAGVGAPHIRQRLWWVGVADAEMLRRSQRELRDGHGAANAPEGDHGGGRPKVVGLHGVAGGGADGVLAHANGGHASAEGLQRGREPGQQPQDAGAGFWSDLEWLPCRDGKARPTRPGLFPLAHGVSGRVGLLRGAGNAIVPQAGAAFVRAVRAALSATPGAAA